LLSFALVLVSGVVLYFVPPGRVANVSDILLLGLNKTQWQVLHVSSSLLFLAAAFLHLVFNWRPMKTYFKDRATRRFGISWQWVFPVLICALFLWGSVRGVWPFHYISQWHQQIKQSYDEGGQGMGRRAQSLATTQPAAAAETPESGQGRGVQRRIRGGRNAMP